MECWNEGKMVKGIVSDPPPFHSSNIPSFSPGGGIGVDGPAEAEDFFFAVFGLEAGKDFGGGGAAEFEEPHGVGDEYGENFVFEVSGFGIGVELGADDLGPVGGDLGDLGVGGELHFLEDAGNEGTEGDGAGVGVGGGVGVDVESLAGDGPLAFVIGFSAVHGGILAEGRGAGQTHLKSSDHFNAKGARGARGTQTPIQSVKKRGINSVGGQWRNRYLRKDVKVGEPGDPSMNEEQSGQSQEPGRSMRGGGVFLLCVALLIVLPMISIFSWRAFLPAPEKSHRGENVDSGVQFEMDPMVANVTGTSGERCMRVQVQLVIDKVPRGADLRWHVPMLKDRIGMAMSRQVLEELEGPSGRERLKEGIKKEINDFLKAETGMEVVDVYFSEFLIQGGAVAERGAL